MTDRPTHGQAYAVHTWLWDQANELDRLAEGLPWRQRRKAEKIREDLHRAQMTISRYAYPDSGHSVTEDVVTLFRMAGRV